MYKKLIAFILMSTFLFSTALSSFLTSRVFATSPQILHVPTPYPTIQSAIDAANPGDTIQVASGFYHEYIVIDKSVSLIGENPSNTIIDGSGTGSDTILVLSNVNYVRIEGFTIQKGEGFGLESTNLRMTNSKGHTIKGNIIRQSSNGLRLAEINDSYIINNVITDNTAKAGIYLSFSSRNSILANLIEKNAIGVQIADSASKDNILIHNNFVDNISPAAAEGAPANFWHNGAEGNYWSDYNGTDTDGNGIGDTGGCPGACTPVHSVDWYPLVERWSETRYFPSYQTVVRCNSTVASFNFSYQWAQISFNVTGPKGAVSFCNVTIDKSVLDGDFTVFVNQSSRNYVLTENNTHTSIYFTFTHSSTSKIQIRGTKVLGNLIPIANFTYAPIRPRENDEVQFTDASIDPDGTVSTWLWDFGDGNTSSSRNATHTYAKGRYNVTLTVTDNEGVMDSTVKKIVVGNLAPTANFTYSPPLNPKENQDIQFTDSSIDPDGTVATWLWDFGDGNTSSQQNPIHKYMNKGTFNVTLTVTDNDGATNATTKTIVVEASSQSDYTLYYILGGSAAGALILGIALFLLKRKKPLASTKLVTR